MNKALDEVRAGESRRIASGGVAVLKKSRWLRRQTRRESEDGQRFRLRDLLRYNLKTYVLTFLRKPFSSSGITTRPHGPESSWMTGVGK